MATAVLAQTITHTVVSALIGRAAHTVSMAPIRRRGLRERSIQRPRTPFSASPRTGLKHPDMHALFVPHSARYSRRHSHRLTHGHRLIDLCTTEYVTLYLLASHQFANIAIESFRDTKKNIGKDISVLSFDSNFMESFAPYISTISQPVNEVNKYKVTFQLPPPIPGR